MVVYQDEFGGSATDTDIKYAIFAPTGGPPLIGPNVVSGANGSGLETVPDVATRPFGGFVVTWTDPDSTVTDIRATVFNSVGGVVASNILVNTATTGEQNEANVVALSDGDFVVTWENDNASLVRAQRFDALGSKIGTEFTVKAGISVDSPEAGLLVDGRIAYAVGDVSTGDADVMTSIWDPRTLVRNFDGIHQTDLLWQHDSGQAAVWLLNDTSFVSGTAVGPGVGPSWHLEGDGDFNADGHSDFLWQNDSGQAAIWLMNGTSLIAGAALAPNPGPSWHLIDSGDFNADGNDDILWQDDSGQAAVWLMNGTSLVGGGPVGPNPGADWHVKATGDFNVDDKSDILWQHDSGAAAIWLMNGTSLISGGAVGPNPGADWHVIDSGDFNGDLQSDILWQHDSGQAAVWLMKGASLLAGAAVGPNPGADWHVQGAGQFNDADIRSDILWQTTAAKQRCGSWTARPCWQGWPSGPTRARIGTSSLRVSPPSSRRRRRQDETSSPPTMPSSSDPISINLGRLLPDLSGSNDGRNYGVTNGREPTSRRSCNGAISILR